MALAWLADLTQPRLRPRWTTRVPRRSWLDSRCVFPERLEGSLASRVPPTEAPGLLAIGVELPAVDVRALGAVFPEREEVCNELP